MTENKKEVPQGKTKSYESTSLEITRDLVQLVQRILTKDL